MSPLAISSNLLFAYALTAKWEGDCMTICQADELPLSLWTAPLGAIKDTALEMLQRARGQSIETLRPALQGLKHWEKAPYQGTSKGYPRLRQADSEAYPIGTILYGARRFAMRHC